MNAPTPSRGRLSHGPDPARGASGLPRRQASVVTTVLLLAALLPWPLRAAVDEAPAPDSTDTDISHTVARPRPGAKDISPAPAHPLGPGESLHFTVQYGMIHAGNAYLEVPDLREWNGHEVYSLVARAESNSFFSHI